MYFAVYDIETFNYLNSTSELMEKIPYALGYQVFLDEKTTQVTQSVLIKTFYIEIDEEHKNLESYVHQQKKNVIKLFMDSLVETCTSYAIKNRIFSNSTNKPAEINIYDFNGGGFDKHFIVPYIYENFNWYDIQMCTAKRHHADVNNTENMEITTKDENNTENMEITTKDENKPYSISNIIYMITKARRNLDGIKGTRTIKIYWKDFMCIFRKTSLSNVACYLGLSMDKLHFPYNFSIIDNLYYIGGIPEHHYYDNKCNLSEYRSIKTLQPNNIFDMKVETIAYLRQDLNILGSAISTFRNIVYHKLGVDVLGTFTIAHLAKKALKLHITKEYIYELALIEKLSSSIHLVPYPKGSKEYKACHNPIYVENRSKYLNSYINSGNKMFPLQSINEYTDKFIRLGYYGGRNELISNKNIKNNSITVYDVNSLYPQILNTYKMPSQEITMQTMSCYSKSAYNKMEKSLKVYNDKESFSMHIRSRVTNTNIMNYYSYNIFLAFFDITIEIDKHNLLRMQPCVHRYLNSEINFPSGIISGVMCEIDVVAAMVFSGAEIKEIRSTKIFQCDKFDTSFIEDMSTWKSKLREDGNKGLSQIPKIILNSITGSFGMNLESYAWVLEEELKEGKVDEESVDFDEKTIYRTHISNIKEDRKRDLINHIKVTNSHTHTHVAATITALGRLYIYSTIYNNLDLNSIMYIDTDSIHTTGKLPSHLLDDNKMGFFKVEHENCNAIYLGKKKYILYKDDEVLSIKTAGFGYRDQLNIKHFEDALDNKPTDKINNRKFRAINGGVCEITEKYTLKVSNKVGREKDKDSNWFDTMPMHNDS